MIGFTRALARAMASEQIARQAGLLQSLDPRVRVIGLFVMVVAAVLSRKITVIAALFFVAVIIAMLSRVSIGMLVKRVWLVVLDFTGVIAFPAIFLTPGDPVAAFADGPVRITVQGVQTATLLVARVETAVTFTSLLVLCTPWMHVLKALRALRLPQEAVRCWRRRIAISSFWWKRQDRCLNRARAGRWAFWSAKSSLPIFGRERVMTLAGSTTVRATSATTLECSS